MTTIPAFYILPSPEKQYLHSNLSYLIFFSILSNYRIPVSVFLYFWAILTITAAQLESKGVTETISLFQRVGNKVVLEICAFQRKQNKGRDWCLGLYNHMAATGRLTFGNQTRHVR